MEIPSSTGWTLWAVSSSILSEALEAEDFHGA